MLHIRGRTQRLDTVRAPIQKRAGRWYRTFLRLECLKFLDVARGLETPLWIDRLSDLDEGHTHGLI